MNKFQERLKQILFINPIVVLLADVITVISLYLIFENNRNDTWWVAVFYAFAFISLVWTVCFIINISKPLWEAMKEWPFIGKVITDMDYRSWLFMIFSCFLNLTFAGFNVYQGVLQQSDWLKAVSAYYFILMLLRLWLIVKHEINKKEQDTYIYLRREYVSFVNTGIGLAVLTLAMCSVIVEMIIKDEHFTYPFFLSFGVIAVAFYNVGMSIWGMHKYNTMKRPILRANKMLNLPVAVMSIFFCQTMMLITFGGDGGAANRRLFNSVTGGLLFVISVVTSIYMVRAGHRALVQLERLHKTDN